MKSSITPLIVVLMALMLALGACKGRENATGQATETIAPADPQPEETGTDAMTQTVDIEEGRTDAEGGALTTPGAPIDTTLDGTSGTTTSPATTPVPATTTTR